MQLEQRQAQSFRRPTRLIKYPHPSNVEAAFFAPAGTAVDDAPVVNLYGNEPFGRTLPTLPQVSIPPKASPLKQEPAWKTLFNLPVVKVTPGLLIGLGLLYLVTRFVDVPTTLHVLRQHLATPRGIILGLLSGMAFLTAFIILALRWKLFLILIAKFITFKAIHLFFFGFFFIFF